MKRMAAYGIVAACALMGACELLVNPAIRDYPSRFNEQAIDIQFTSVNDAWYWISRNIQYVEDEDGGFKQTPEETYARRKGDCEDYALLLAYFAYTINDPITVVRGHQKGHDSYHIANRYKGSIIEPQLYTVIHEGFTVTDEWDYEDAYYSDDIR